MATPQELAKVKALVNTGVSAEEAARQVKSDSFGISPDFIAKQQAKRQAKLAPPVDAINPAAPTIQMQADTAKAAEPVAPVAPPVSQPVVPATMKEPVAPVAPVAPKAPKAEAPKFMTDTQRREQLGGMDKQASQDQMLANVDIMAKEDAGVLTDRAKFEAKTGYAGKPPEEKAILDTYFKSNVPTTAGDIKKQLFAGVEIKDPKIVNTPAYRQAKFEKERLSRYTGMSSEQLFNEMKSGLPTAASEALRGTPAFQEAVAKFDQYKKVDNINQTAKFIATGKSPEKDPLAELSNQLTTIFNQQDQTGSTAEAYRTFISQNPEITEPTAEYNTKMAQKKEFERAREALVEDLKKKYAGEPLSTILSIAARESKPINDQINTLNDSLATLSADIKFKTDLATQEFGFFTQDQQAKAAKQAKLQDLLGNLAISQFGRQQDQAFDLKKEEIKQKFETDKDAINYIRELNTLGIKNIYDLERMSMDQDFQKELAAINNKYKTSQSVRDFRNALKLKSIDLEDAKTMAEYTASLDPDKAAKWEEIRAKATENSSLADLYGRNVGTYEGNRGYDLAGKLGDPIVAPPGGEVVEVRTADGSQYFIENGAAQFAKGTDVGYGNSVLLKLPDGKFMRLSHLQDINVQPGDKLTGGAIIGTRGNSGKVLGKNGEKLTPEQLAAGRGAHVDIEIGGALLPDGQIDTKSLLSNADQAKYLSQIKPFASNNTQPLTDKQYTQFNQAVGRFTGNPQVKAFEAALSSGGDLISSLQSENGPGDVSAIFQFMKTLDPASVVREGEFAIAESSAGLPSKTANLYDKVMKGERLTDEQRKAFGKIAFKFIENKAKLYDSHYKDMTKVLKLQGIPESYYPTKVSDYLTQYSQGSEGDRYDQLLNNLSQ